MSFSALDRRQHINTLSSTQWDLVIIGGGITGAGILLDAISRGLKVALVEKNDFASGTSSRSTKLIHGGLRYLRNFEIGLVREVGRERAIVYENARHLVRPEPMLLPIYHDSSIGRITGSIGLWFYDFLADVDKTERRRMLSREETITHEPLLRQDGLIGSGLYYEYRTDDARLTLAILRKAVLLGALALNYCEVNGFQYAGENISGITCIDVMTGQKLHVNAHVVVNATGPWMDTVLRLHNQTSKTDQKLLLSKGVHLVVPKEKLPVNQSIYFDVQEDGRMIFCIPRERSVYIGTTDTEYHGSMDDIRIQPEDINYLLAAVNHITTSEPLSSSDIIGSWAGVRPLIYEEGKSPSEVSRRDEIFHTPEGLISIAGGKLTGYRKMAERVVDLVMKRIPALDQKEIACQTRSIRVSGGDFESEVDLQAQLMNCISTFPQFEADVITKLFFRYGTGTVQIFSDAVSTGGKRPEETLIRAEVAYAIKEEMTHLLSDFLRLRTSDMLFDQPYLRRAYRSIVESFGQELNWDASRLDSELTTAAVLAGIEPE